MPRGGPPGIWEGWRTWAFLRQNGGIGSRKYKDVRASTCLFLVMCGRTSGDQSMVRVRSRKRQLQGPSHMQVLLATQPRHRRVCAMSQRTALADVKVLDLTQFEAGASCTQALARLGGRIIKIEKPPGGDQGGHASTDPEGQEFPHFIPLK